MGSFQVRTDLALEARESISEADSELRGVSVEEYYREEEDVRVTKVTIDTKNAAKNDPARPKSANNKQDKYLLPTIFRSLSGMDNIILAKPAFLSSLKHSTIILKNATGIKSVSQIGI